LSHFFTNVFRKKNIFALDVSEEQTSYAGRLSCLQLTWEYTLFGDTGNF